ATLHRRQRRRTPVLHASRVSFEPCIDPLRSDPDRSTASDARVVQLTTFAGSVDRVAADTRILGTLGNGQPGLHGPSALARALADHESSCDGDLRAEARRRCGRRGASHGRGCRHDASIEPRGRLVHTAWATISAIVLVPPTSMLTT